MPERVRIHRVTDAPTGDPPGTTGPGVAITYSTPDVGPRTVFIEADKDSPEERQRVIKEDLEAVRGTRREYIDLP